MEIIDVLWAIAFGVAAAIWVGVFTMIYEKWIRRRPMLKIGFPVIIPGLSWFVIAFGLLAVGGTAIPDTLGMQMLMTGIVIFVLSIIGIVLKKMMPIIKNAVLFMIMIVVVSIAMQLIWLGKRY